MVHNFENSSDEFMIIHGSPETVAGKLRDMESIGIDTLVGEFDFGFSTTLMRKDVSLVLDEADRKGFELPVTALVAELLDEVDAMGGANGDWCSLMQRTRAAATA